MGARVVIDLAKCFRKRYSLRWVDGRKRFRTIEAVLPFEVVEREAQHEGVDVATFISTHDIEYAYDAGGVYVTFPPKVEKAREHSRQAEAHCPDNSVVPALGGKRGMG